MCVRVCVTVSMSIALVLLCGLPAIGKSTLCRALVAAAQLRGTVAAVHIEFDDILQLDNDTSVGSDASENSQMESWRAARERIACDVERRIATYKSDANRSEHMLLLLIDDNLYYESMRARFILAARRHAAQLALIVAQPTDDVDLVIGRNASRIESRRVPEHVIRRMAQRLDPPTPAELPRTVFVDCSADNVSADAVLDDVLRVCLEVPLLSLEQLAASEAQREQQRSADRALVSESRRHRRELIARTLVGSLVQSATPEQRATVARALNACKRRVMGDATLDEIESDDEWRAQAAEQLSTSMLEES